MTTNDSPVRVEPVVIPAMVDPLGAHWNQPDRNRIAIDSTHALMDEATFLSLAEYSTSYPSGVYEGKMWKAKCRGKWWLRWYGYSVNPDCCSNNQREILAV